MKKNIILSISILVMVSFLVVSCGPQYADQVTKKTVTTTEGGTLTLGAIAPLSGDAAAYGVPIQQAIDLAVEEINDAGGVAGKELKILYEDGQCDAKGATSAAQKLINVDGVRIIIGGLCSGETLGAAPIAEENKVILFSAGSGSPDITTAGDYIFRNFPSDATSGSKVAEAAVDNKDTKIAILAEQTDYAQAVKNVFKDKFEDLGGKVVVDESYLSESSDYRTQLTKIKNAKPLGIYIVSQTPAKYGLVLKQMAELGVDAPIYTNEFAAAEDILGVYGDEIEGAIFAEPAFDENAQKSKELLEKIKDKHGELSGALPPVYFATAYDAVYILVEAIEECGEDTSCIKAELYGVSNRLGTAGTLSIDKNGDAEFEYVLKTIKNGKVVEK